MLLNLKPTRKRALHAEMSHSTVGDTIVPTKKIRLTLVKKLCKLRITLHSCREKALVILKKNATRGVCVFVEAIKRRYGNGCLYVCYLHSTLRPEIYMCVALHRSRVGMCVLCTRSCMGMGAYVSHFSTLSNRQLLVCVCMYMFANTGE